jgi:hypothetical protein
MIYNFKSSIRHQASGDLLFGFFLKFLFHHPILEAPPSKLFWFQSLGRFISQDDSCKNDRQGLPV